MNRRTTRSSDHFNNNNNNRLHSSQHHHIMNDECDDESIVDHHHTTSTTNTTTINNNNNVMKIWELPEPILCYILCYIAVPTKRSYVICHQLAPLCKESYQYLLGTSGVGCIYSHTIWETILNEDYYNTSMYGKAANNNNKNYCSKQQQQRSSKRLKQSSFEQIQNAHRTINERSEAAFIELCNIIRCSSSSHYNNIYNNNITNTSSIRKKKKNSQNKLSLTTLKSIFQHYGPYIHLNHCMSSGGVFLVEICRARNVKESVIYKCFEWLVEVHHADINIMTYESKNNQQTSLCVAAVRGMSSIVQYLLNHNVKTDVKCSGRFTLSSTIISSNTATSTTNIMKRNTAGQKTVLTCYNKTAYEFAIEMYNAEVNVGICTKLLDKTLGKCIKLLEPYQSSS